MVARKKTVTGKTASAARTAKVAAPVAPAQPDPVMPRQAAAEPASEPRPVIAKKPKDARYQLPTNMEIAALGQVHADLLALSSSNDGPYILDGANLSVIDAAGLQLLVSFVSAVKASGKKVSWDNYSVQAYQLANELGVVEQLGD